MSVRIRVSGQGARGVQEREGGGWYVSTTGQGPDTDRWMDEWMGVITSMVA